MWYVIGAALIFIMSSTMHQLFTSVGGTFESKTDDVMDVVDGTQPNTYKNLYTNGNVHWFAYATGYGWSMGDRLESVLYEVMFK